MDDALFDAWVRGLDGSPNRRGLLGSIAGAVLGGFSALHESGNAIASEHKKKRRRRRRKRQRRRERRRDNNSTAQCTANTPTFETPTATCFSSDECCGSGSCCTFDDGLGGLITGCFDLLTNQTACGLSCETAINCLNFTPDRQCIGGACVET